MDPTAPVLVIHVRRSRAFATMVIIGAIYLTLVRILTSVYLVSTIVCHRPDVSTHQGPIAASVLPSQGGPSMAHLVKILMSASTQTCAIHKLCAATFPVDLTAAVTWDGEDKEHILYA